MEQREEMFTLKDLSESRLQAILDFVLRHCSRFSLVRSLSLAGGEKLTGTIDSLKPYYVRAEMTDKWPGTQLLGGLANSYLFEVTEESIGILRRSPFLFSWSPSENMVDLAFFSRDNKPWMYTIAHESVYFIDTGALPGIDQGDLLCLLDMGNKIIEI